MDFGGLFGDIVLVIRGLYIWWCDIILFAYLDIVFGCISFALRFGE